MVDITTNSSGRSARHRPAAHPGTRRLVGFERHYTCDTCGSERSSWTRLPACPQCGEPFMTAVIRRAAVA